jgi:S-adenosylmethionine:tRNA ribosyltransferase-isomerase
LSVAARERSGLVLADFDYDLPPDLIAQQPLARRDGARLLVVDKGSGVTHQSSIARLVDWLSAGDLLVVNNSRVIPARLRGRRAPGGGSVEVLLLRREGDAWSALARPAKRLKVGTRLVFPPRDSPVDPAAAVVVANVGTGEVRLRFEDGADERLDDYGETPLPPYIKEPLQDATRYQTVYASAPGSAAAPTAGLHFTTESIEELTRAGLDWAG